MVVLLPFCFLWLDIVSIGKVEGFGLLFQLVKLKVLDSKLRFWISTSSTRKMPITVNETYCITDQVSSKLE
jgi:hypothetical protein